MLPIDIILVRHGESEGNVVHKASRKGDNRLFTPEFRDRHSRTFRLTDKGIAQAKTAGAWLRANVRCRWTVSTCPTTSAPKRRRRCWICQRRVAR